MLGKLFNNQINKQPGVAVVTLTASVCVRPQNDLTCLKLIIALASQVKYISKCVYVYTFICICMYICVCVCVVVRTIAYRCHQVAVFMWLTHDLCVDIIRQKCVYFNTL